LASTILPESRLKVDPSHELVAVPGSDGCIKASYCDCPS
jgi:hypothetical protein